MSVSRRTRGILFVVDGGKAIAKAVDDVYGTLAVTTRCRRHKERNILDHLPEAERPLARRKLREAWGKTSPVEARANLDALARSLAHKRPGAAASLREGLEETLTVNRLGVTGTLLKTLESTNPVESMTEIVRMFKLSEQFKTQVLLSIRVHAATRDHHVRVHDEEHDDDATGVQRRTQHAGIADEIVPSHTRLRRPSVRRWDAESGSRVVLDLGVEEPHHIQGRRWGGSEPDSLLFASRSS